MRYQKALIYSFAVISSIAPLTARADCAKNKLKPVEKTTATAAAWANLKKAEGSLRIESERLLSSAAKILSLSTTAKSPTLIFESKPKKFLSDYSDRADCEAKFKQSKAKPYTFGSLTFQSVEEINTWFSSFSQGKGEEGIKLYQLCSGSCSPQYKLSLTKKGSAFAVATQVVCGPARDKNDNMYDLSLNEKFAC
jgi:hypothetical protein